MPDEKPESIDVKSLKVEDIDKLGHEALKSVIRPQMHRDGHKDHRSHSNT